MHEGMPMLMSWNGTGPDNPNIDPITYGEFLDLSFHEVQNMTALGMPGVQTWNFGEACSMLYMDSVAMNQNSVFFSCERRHTRFDCDWSSDVCSSDLREAAEDVAAFLAGQPVRVLTA